MPDYHGGKARRKALLGLHIARETATQGSGDNAIYTIHDGMVLMTSIVGEVTVAIGGANDTKLVSTPTTGTATDLCLVSDIDTCDIGDLLSIDGVPGSTLYSVHKGAVPVMLGQGVVIQTGTLNLNCANDVTGSIKWVVTYVPLDADAYMKVA